MKNIEVIPFRQGISYQLSARCLLAALIIGVLLSFVQIYMDKQEEQNYLQSSVTQLFNSNKLSAANALYSLDENEAQAVIKGILQYPAVISAEINFVDADILHYKEAKITPEAHNWYEEAMLGLPREITVDLYKDNNAEGQFLGFLKLEIDPVLAAQNFTLRSILYMLSGIIRNLFLAIIFIALFQRFIAKPIDGLIQALVGFDPKDSQQAIYLPDYAHKTNEIGTLRSTVEQLIQENGNYLRELHAAQNKILLMNESLEEQVDLRTTQLQQSNAHLVEAMQQVKETQEKLIQADRMAALTNVLQSIAHQIKEPLNFITNFSQLSLEDAKQLIVLFDQESSESETQREDILEQLFDFHDNCQRIYVNGLKIDEIVNAMIEQVNNSEGKVYTFDINQAVRDYVEIAYLALQKAHSQAVVKIQLQLGDELQAVKMNAASLRQTLMDLLGIALHNTYRSNRRSSVPGEITVVTTTSEEVVTIKVEYTVTGDFHDDDYYREQVASIEENIAITLNGQLMAEYDPSRQLANYRLILPLVDPAS